MPRKLWVSMIIILIITNIATLLFWNMDKKALLINEQKISNKDRVALIGEEEILYEDWIDGLQDSHGRDHLEKMIDRSIVTQLADQERVIINEKVIDREIAMLTSMQGIISDKMLERLKENWRKDVLYRYQLETLLIQDISITEEAAREHYEAHSNQYDFTETMQLSHIVVEDEATASKVIRELDEGANFNLLAQEYSNDEETKDRGGYLGFLSTESTLIDGSYFVNADAMKEHSYSDAFNINGGVAILFLHQSLPSITFTYEEMAPYIKNELAFIQFEQPLVTDSLWDQMDIEWIYGD